MDASGQNHEIVVFIVHRDSACSECGKELPRKSFLRMERDKPLCLACADLDRLEFLGRGDAAVTRRAKKHPTLWAVVVEWPRTRKGYERQGILAEPEAIDRAVRAVPCGPCRRRADHRRARLPQVQRAGRPLGGGEGLRRGGGLSRRAGARASRAHELRRTTVSLRRPSPGPTGGQGVDRGGSRRMVGAAVTSRAIPSGRRGVWVSTHPLYPHMPMRGEFTTGRNISSSCSWSAAQSSQSSARA
jgi:hypothetical protein